MLINKDEFVKCAVDAGLFVDEKMLSSESYVDSILQNLLKIAQLADGYLGSGIGRSAFKLGNYVLKVARSIVNVEEDMWSDSPYATPYDKSDEINSLTLNRADEGFNQNYQECNWYLNKRNQAYLTDAAGLYAFSSNYAIELAEYCELLSGDDYEDLYDEESEIGGLFAYYDSHYRDIHEDNVGLNKDGKLVILDLGWMTC